MQNNIPAVLAVIKFIYDNIMYAELKADGYETLTYECKFTIGSAFDTDLLIVDIVLGVIAIGLGAAVVCLAIRRYKEC